MKKNYFILLLIGLLFFAPISLFSQVRYSMLREYVSRGNLDACVQLAILLWNGDGVKQDRQEALALFNQAADGGNASAFFLLGHVMDAEGNQEQAFENYKKAADAGLMDAINTVAYRYANGQGTEQSYEMAHQYIDTILNAETVPNADKAMYYDSKGEFYLMNKEWGKAKEMLDKALEMNPSLASEKTVLYQAFYSEDSELAKERLAAEMAEANRHAAEWAEEERLKAEEAGAKRIAQEKDNKTEIEAEKNTTETIAADGVVSQKVDEEHFVEEQNVKEDNNASEILSERIEPDLLVAEEKKVSDVSPTVKRKEQESVKEKRTRESTSGLVQSVGVSTAGFSEIYFYDDLENNMVIDVADDRTLFFLDYSIGYQFSSGLRFSLLFEGTILKEFQYDGPYHIEPVTPGVQLAACAEARYSAVVGKLCPFLAIGIGHSLMGLETNGIDPYYVKIGQAFRLRGKQCVELSIGYKTIYATESFSFSVAYSF